MDLNSSNYSRLLNNDVPNDLRQQEEIIRKSLEEDFKIYLSHIFDDLHLKEINQTTNEGVDVNVNSKNEGGP